MQEIQQLSRDFLRDLANINLIASVQEGASADSPCNVNSKKPKLLSAAVCAGLYPQVSRIIRPPKRFEEVMGSAFEKDDDSKEIKFYVPSHVTARGAEGASMVTFPVSADPTNP